MTEIDLKTLEDKELFTEVLRRFKCMLKPSGTASFIGPYGTGKTLQAKRLANMNCWCYVNAYDVIHEHIQKQTEIGKKAKKSLDLKQPVTDEIIAEAVYQKTSEPMCDHGVVFDGFPHNISQAVKFDSLLFSEKKQIERIVQFKCPEEILFERIIKIGNNPFSDKISEFSTGDPKFYQNLSREKFSDYIDKFYSNQYSVIRYYNEKQKLIVIDASLGSVSVWDELFSIFIKKYTPVK